MRVLVKFVAIVVIVIAVVLWAQGDLRFSDPPATAASPRTTEIQATATQAATPTSAPVTDGAVTGTSTVTAPVTKPDGYVPENADVPAGQVRSGAVFSLTSPGGYVVAPGMAGVAIDPDSDMLDSVAGEMSLVGLPTTVVADAVVANTSSDLPGKGIRPAGLGPTTLGVTVGTLIDAWAKSRFAGPQPAVLKEQDGTMHALSVYKPSFDRDVLTLSYAAARADQLPAKLIAASGAAGDPVLDGELPASWSGAALYLMLPSVRVIGGCVLLPAANCDNLVMFGQSLEEQSMPGSSFVGTMLDQASLRNGDFHNADFRRASLYRADLYGADLSGALTGPKTGMSQVSAQNANLTGALLAGVAMSRSDFTGADFTGATISGADASAIRAGGATFDGVAGQQTEFPRSYLKGASFVGADLSGANFAYADLRGVDFKDAILTGADFYGALMKGANMSGAEVIGVKCPSGATVTRTTCDWVP